MFVFVLNDHLSDMAWVTGFCQQHFRVCPTTTISVVVGHTFTCIVHVPGFCFTLQEGSPIRKASVSGCADSSSCNDVPT